MRILVRNLFDNKKSSWFSYHVTRIFPKWWKLSLKNKFIWNIGINSLYILSICRFFELTCHGTIFNYFTKIVYNIRNNLTRDYSFLQRSVLCTLCSNPIPKVFLIYNIICSISQNDCKRYIVNDRCNRRFIINQEDYGARKSTIKMQEREKIEKLITKISNGANGGHIMKLSFKLANEIGGIMGDDAMLCVKGSGNIFGKWKYDINKIFGKQRCHKFLGAFNHVGDKEGGGDLDIGVVLFNEISIEKINKITSVLCRYFISLYGALNKIGRISIQGDEEHYYEFSSDTDQLMRKLTNLFPSVTFEKKYSSVACPGFQLYLCKWLWFRLWENMFCLLRGKSDWRRINIKTGKIVGYYSSEHIDISVDCIDSVEIDRSKYVKRNNIYWLKWEFYLKDVLRLLSDPRGDILRLARMMDRIQICQRIDAIFGDWLRWMDNGGSLEDLSKAVNFAFNCLKNRECILLDDVLKAVCFSLNNSNKNVKCMTL